MKHEDILRYFAEQLQSLAKQTQKAKLTQSLEAFIQINSDLMNAQQRDYKRENQHWVREL